MRKAFWSVGLLSYLDSVDLIAEVDLGSKTEINRLSIRFYQLATVWIWLPDSVEFQVSDDGLNWESVALIKHKASPHSQEQIINEFAIEGLSLQANQIRIIAKTIGTCPDWHPGAGGPSWIFADEIVVQ